MAIMNSVASRAPRCWVSDKFHMRPRISFGSLARSKICFAVSPVPKKASVVSRELAFESHRSHYIPGSTPVRFTSDLSKSDVNLLTSSGFNGGTRIGPPADGGGLVVPRSRPLGAEASTTIPSKRGRGPATSNVSTRTAQKKTLGNHATGHLRCRARSSVGARPA